MTQTAASPHHDRSEGQANATVQLAHAESTALDTVAAMIAADNCSQTDYMVAQRYLEFFRQLGGACDDKVRPTARSGRRAGWGAEAMRRARSGALQTVYLPYDVNSMRGLVRTLPSAYGRSTQSLVRPVLGDMPPPAYKPWRPLASAGCKHGYAFGDGRGGGEQGRVRRPVGGGVGRTRAARRFPVGRASMPLRVAMDPVRVYKSGRGAAGLSRIPLLCHP